jgi:hypothetical protein
MITCDIKLKSAQSMTCSDDYDESLEFKSDLETLEIRVSLIEFIAFALCLSLSHTLTHSDTRSN